MPRQPRIQSLRLCTLLPVLTTSLLVTLMLQPAHIDASKSNRNPPRHNSSNINRRHISEDLQEEISRSLVNEVQPRIFGGWATTEDRYSYAQVSLDTFGDGHQCGGSLIAVDVVLTAAHCAGSYDRVIIGKHNIYNDADESETFGVLMEIVHPDYDEQTTRFDVMLIVLDGYSTLATPVRVNNNVDLPVNGEDLTVVGWGYDQNWDLPELLQETEVIYSSNAVCITYEDSDGQTLEDDLYADMMCAGDVERDACYGDSGSPLMLVGDNVGEDIQVGTVSWGYECAGDLPGIYSRLGFWATYNFIQEQVCEHSIQPPTNYMDCGQSAAFSTDSPTTATPTMSPSDSPSSAPSHSPAFQPPTLAPSTQALRDFLTGTTAGPANTEDGSADVFDDAFFFDEGTSSANSLNSQTSGDCSLWSRGAPAAILCAAVLGTLGILC